MVRHVGVTSHQITDSSDNSRVYPMVSLQIKPKMTWITASIYTVAYALLIIWNIIVFYIATGRIT